MTTPVQNIQVAFSSRVSASSEGVFVGNLRPVGRSNRLLVRVTKVRPDTHGRMFALLDSIPGFARTTTPGMTIKGGPRNQLVFAALFDSAAEADAARLVISRQLDTGEKVFAVFLSPKVVE